MKQLLTSKLAVINSCRPTLMSIPTMFVPAEKIT